MAELSDVFKYISYFRQSGHQVGRKVGDMLEVLTFAAIAVDDKLMARLNVEPKLYGFSGAGHKVEFALMNKENRDIAGVPDPLIGYPVKDLKNIIGFVECKKVGVEQTVNGSFKQTFQRHDNRSYRVPYNKSFILGFNPRDVQVNFQYKILFSKYPQHKIKIVREQDNYAFEESLVPNHRIIFTLESDGNSFVLGNKESLRQIRKPLRSCKILEIMRSENDYVVALLNDCLPGPQTPEKAKQSSFVALDIRKARFNSFDKRDNEIDCVSILVITEFSHWEEKSQNMIRSCIDRNVVVDDNLIIRAFEKFEKRFGTNFYNKISKDSFLHDPDVRQISIDLVNSMNRKIFRDIEDNQYKRITLSDNNKLILI